MEIWVASLGLIGVVGTALISRWPALSGDGRLRDSIARDTALWEKLPPGKGRDDFADHIANRAKSLQERRTAERDRQQETWAAATTAMVIAYILLVAASAIEGSRVWLESVVALLYVFGGVAAVVGVLLAIATVVPPIWKALRVLWAWSERLLRFIGRWLAVVGRKRGVESGASVSESSSTEGP
ncbi:hypothetical protein [Cellulomonas endometrii]|uniref:hypothetical protein n=1 Tax=Cellulomonas endometrii TaxID=3036301 RepID=UPI0024AD1FFC|nr:hypothetical protein [Cellulomonas endometrii]